MITFKDDESCNCCALAAAANSCALRTSKFTSFKLSLNVGFSYDDDNDHGVSHWYSTQGSVCESATSSIPSSAKRPHCKKYAQILGRVWVFHSEISSDNHKSVIN